MCSYYTTLSLLWNTFKRNTQIKGWRHQMETFSALLALCEGNPLATGGFPSERLVTRSFDVFLYVRLKPWTNGWANSRDSGDLRCHGTHYDITVMHWHGRLLVGNMWLLFQNLDLCNNYVFIMLCVCWDDYFCNPMTSYNFVFVNIRTPRLVFLYLTELIYQSGTKPNLVFFM